MRKLDIKHKLISLMLLVILLCPQQGYSLAPRTQVEETKDSARLMAHRFQRYIYKELVEEVVTRGGYGRNKAEKILRGGLTWTDGVKIGFKDDSLFEIARDVLNSVLERKRRKERRPHHDIDIDCVKAVLEYHEAIHLCLRKQEGLIEQVQKKIFSLLQKRRYDALLRYFENQYGEYKGEDREHDIIEEMVVSLYVEERAFGNPLRLLGDEEEVDLERFAPQLITTIKIPTESFINSIDIDKLQYGKTLNEMYISRHIPEPEEPARGPSPAPVPSIEPIMPGTKIIYRGYETLGEGTVIEINLQENWIVIDFPKGGKKKFLWSLVNRRLEVVSPAPAMPPKETAGPVKLKDIWAQVAALDSEIERAPSFDAKKKPMEKRNELRAELWRYLDSTRIRGDLQWLRLSGELEIDMSELQTAILDYFVEEEEGDVPKIARIMKLAEGNVDYLLRSYVGSEKIRLVRALAKSRREELISDDERPVIVRELLERCLSDHTFPGFSFSTLPRYFESKDKKGRKMQGCVIDLTYIGDRRVKISEGILEHIGKDKEVIVSTEFDPDYGWLFLVRASGKTLFYRKIKEKDSLDIILDPAQETIVDSIEPKNNIFGAAIKPRPLPSGKFTFGYGQRVIAEMARCNKFSDFNLKLYPFRMNARKLAKRGIFRMGHIGHREVALRSYKLIPEQEYNITPFFSTVLGSWVFIVTKKRADTLQDENIILVFSIKEIKGKIRLYQIEGEELDSVLTESGRKEEYSLLSYMGMTLNELKALFDKEDWKLKKIWRKHIRDKLPDKRIGIHKLITQTGMGDAFRKKFTEVFLRTGRSLNATAREFNLLFVELDKIIKALKINPEEIEYTEPVLLDVSGKTKDEILDELAGTNWDLFLLRQRSVKKIPNKKIRYKDLLKGLGIVEEFKEEVQGRAVVYPSVEDFARSFGLTQDLFKNLLQELNIEIKPAEPEGRKLMPEGVFTDEMLEKEMEGYPYFKWIPDEDVKTLVWRFSQKLQNRGIVIDRKKLMKLYYKILFLHYLAGLAEEYRELPVERKKAVIYTRLNSAKLPFYKKMSVYWKYKDIFAENVEKIEKILGFSIDYKKDIHGKDTSTRQDLIDWLLGIRDEIPAGFNITVFRDGIHLISTRRMYLFLCENISSIKGRRRVYITFAVRDGNKIVQLWETKKQKESGKKPLMEYYLVKDGNILAQRINGNATDFYPKSIGVEKTQTQKIEEFLLDNGPAPSGHKIKVDSNGAVQLIGTNRVRLSFSPQLAEYIGKTLWATYEIEGNNRFIIIWESEDESKKPDGKYLSKVYLVKDGICLAQKINGGETHKRPIIAAEEEEAEEEPEEDLWSEILKLNEQIEKAGTFKEMIELMAKRNKYRGKIWELLKSTQTGKHLHWAQLAKTLGIDAAELRMSIWDYFVEVTNGDIEQVSIISGFAKSVIDMQINTNVGMRKVYLVRGLARARDGQEISGVERFEIVKEFMEKYLFDPTFPSFFFRTKTIPRQIESSRTVAAIHLAQIEGRPIIIIEGLEKNFGSDRDVTIKTIFDSDYGWLFEVTDCADSHRLALIYRKVPDKIYLELIDSVQQTYVDAIEPRMNIRGEPISPKELASGEFSSDYGARVVTEMARCHKFKDPGLKLHHFQLEAGKAGDRAVLLFGYIENPRYKGGYQQVAVYSYKLVAGTKYRLQPIYSHILGRWVFLVYEGTHLVSLFTGRRTDGETQLKQLKYSELTSVLDELGLSGAKTIQPQEEEPGEDLWPEILKLNEQIEKAGTFQERRQLMDRRNTYRAKLWDMLSSRKIGGKIKMEEFVEELRINPGEFSIAMYDYLIERTEGDIEEITRLTGVSQPELKMFIRHNNLEGKVQWARAMAKINNREELNEEESIAAVRDLLGYLNDSTFPDFRFRRRILPVTSVVGARTTYYIKLTTFDGKDITISEGLEKEFSKAKEAQIITEFNPKYGRLFKVTDGKKTLRYVKRKDKASLDLLEPVQDESKRVSDERLELLRREVWPKIQTLGEQISRAKTFEEKCKLSEERNTYRARLWMLLREVSPSHYMEWAKLAEMLGVDKGDLQRVVWDYFIEVTDGDTLKISKLLDCGEYSVLSRISNFGLTKKLYLVRALAKIKDGKLDDNERAALVQELFKYMSDLTFPSFSFKAVTGYDSGRDCCFIGLTQIEGEQVQITEGLLEYVGKNKGVTVSTEFNSDLGWWLFKVSGENKNLFYKKHPFRNIFELLIRIPEGLEKFIEDGFDRAAFKGMSCARAIGTICKRFKIKAEGIEYTEATRLFYTYMFFEYLKGLRRELNSGKTKEYVLAKLNHSYMKECNKALMDGIIKSYGNYENVFTRNKDRIKEILSFEIDYFRDIHETTDKDIYEWIIKSGPVPKGKYALVDDKGHISVCDVFDLNILVTSTLGSFIGQRFWITFQDDESGQNRFAIIWKDMEDAERDRYGYLRKFYIVKDGKPLSRRFGTVPLLFTYKDEEKVVISGNTISRTEIAVGKNIALLVKELGNPDYNVAQNAFESLKWVHTAAGIDSLRALLKNIKGNPKVQDALRLFYELLISYEKPTDELLEEKISSYSQIKWNADEDEGLLAQVILPDLQNQGIKVDKQRLFKLYYKLLFFRYLRTLAEEYKKLRQEKKKAAICARLTKKNLPFYRGLVEYWGEYERIFTTFSSQITDILGFSIDYKNDIYFAGIPVVEDKESYVMVGLTELKVSEIAVGRHNAYLLRCLDNPKTREEAKEALKLMRNEELIIDLLRAMDPGSVLSQAVWKNMALLEILESMGIVNEQILQRVRIFTTYGNVAVQRKAGELLGKFRGRKEEPKPEDVSPPPPLPVTRTVAESTRDKIIRAVRFRQFCAEVAVRDDLTLDAKVELVKKDFPEFSLEHIRETLEKLQKKEIGKKKGDGGGRGHGGGSPGVFMSGYDIAGFYARSSFLYRFFYDYDLSLHDYDLILQDIETLIRFDLRENPDSRTINRINLLLLKLELRRKTKKQKIVLFSTMPDDKTDTALEMLRDAGLPDDIEIIRRGEYEHKIKGRYVASALLEYAGADKYRRKEVLTVESNQNLWEILDLEELNIEVKYIDKGRLPVDERLRQELRRVGLERLIIEEGGSYINLSSQIPEPLSEDIDEERLMQRIFDDEA